MPRTLQFLGEICFHPPEESHSRLYQPKRLALLAYLCVENRAVRRGEVLELLWPEADQQRASRSLSQLMLELRKDFGQDLFVDRGDGELLLNQSVLSSDVTRIVQALDEGDDATVASLYAGELMPGFIAADCSEYNDWLDRQRERLAAIAAASCARAAARATDPESGISFAERGMQLRPFDDAAVRLYMSICDRQGMSAQALTAYERFKARVQKELAVGPAPATHKLAAEIAAKTPLPPELALATSEESVAQATYSDTISDSTIKQRARRLSWRQIGTSAAAVIAFGFLGYVLHTNGGAATTNETRVNVTAFQTGDSSLVGMSDQLVEGIASGLAGDRTLRVYKRKAQVNGYEIGGTIRRTGEVYTGTLNVTSPDGSISHSSQYVMPISAGIDSVGGHIARLVARYVHPPSASSPLEAAAGYLSAARDHYENGASEQANSAILQAKRELEKTNPRSRDIAWRLKMAEVLAQDGWQRPDSDAAGSVASFNDAALMIRHDTGQVAAEKWASYRSFAVSFTPGSNTAIRDSLADELRASLIKYPSSANLWLELSRVLSSRGNFREAYSAAERVATLDPEIGSHADVLIQTFSAAFNAHMDDAATRQCDQIRHVMQKTWPSVLCSALLVAWADGDYSLEPLSLPASITNDPPDVAAGVAPSLHALLAAAYARTRRISQARRELGLAVGPSEDVNLTATLSLAYGALGDVARSGQLRDTVARAPSGARILNGLYRPFQDLKTGSASRLAGASSIATPH